MVGSNWTATQVGWVTEGSMAMLRDAEGTLQLRVLCYVWMSYGICPKPVVFSVIVEVRANIDDSSTGSDSGGVSGTSVIQSILRAFGC